MPVLLSEGRRDTGAEAEAVAPTRAPSEADPPSPPERTPVIVEEEEEEGGYCSLLGTEGLLSRREEEEEDVEGYWCCIRKGEALDNDAWIEADLGGGGGCG